MADLFEPVDDKQAELSTGGVGNVPDFAAAWLVTVPITRLTITRAIPLPIASGNQDRPMVVQVFI